MQWKISYISVCKKEDKLHDYIISRFQHRDKSNRLITISQRQGLWLGFYLNANKQQAIEMAVRTANRMKAGSPVVSAFEFDETILSLDELKIKIFEDYNIEWAE